MSSKHQVLSLYRALIRESKRFQAYNYRNYALRRVRDAFRDNKDLTDSNRIKDEISRAISNLDVIRRQALIGDLYKTDKLVIEKVCSKT